MSRIKFALLLLVVVVTLGAHELVASTGTTYVVGTCKPGLRTFSSIQSALNETPPPTVVFVCPGTYNEQVTITQPVNLQGVAAGNSDEPVLAPPAGGLTQSAPDDALDSLYFQVWVNNVSGPVNISNITLDGKGNGVTFCNSPPFTAYVVGIFFQNSPGTVNRVTTRNQSGNGCGVGAWLEGGSSNPSVTVANSSIHDFDDLGMNIETNSGTSELTATIKANNVNVPPLGAVGISLQGGTTATVTGNFVDGGLVGGGSPITANSGAAGSISGNTVVGGYFGINTQADGVSVTSNRIFNSVNSGITITTSVAAIQSNSIINTNVGINFVCFANNNNVHSNTIADATTGVGGVPVGVITSNTYFNVVTIRGGC